MMSTETASTSRVILVESRMPRASTSRHSAAMTTISRPATKTDPVSAGQNLPTTIVR
ncbi:hypothetical protein [Cryobacterium breve]|uniref:hypothetical protein n=1 Tax=Cryobacterium breve TaxID=1259258 RepID=UPI00248BB94A|nr:hypothetical protein [Cryobacterium breve]